jgi:siroheme synthase-like protein
VSETAVDPATVVAADEPAPALHPLFLKLAGRRVLLVGGGAVAVAKHRGLRAAGAAITVVAPAVDPALRVAGTTVVERAFVPADVDGAWLVVAAAPPAVNREVLAAAEARRVFVNAVDDPAAATAYAAAVIRRGPVTLALSTGGSAPALAGLLREALASLLPEDLARWGEIAAEARGGWKRDGLPMERRRPLLLRALERLYPRPQEDPR